MKDFANANARDLKHAVTLAEQARRDGRAASFAGGGSDVLGLAKERLIAPDVLINLKTIKGLDRVTKTTDGLDIGGLVTLDALSLHPLIRQDYGVLAEAAGSVATPPIRNVGTLAGNVCQRPWCWYFRNDFPCFKNRRPVFRHRRESVPCDLRRRSELIVIHRTRRHSSRSDATFRIVGPAGERLVPAAEFFVLPRENSARENVLGADDVLASVRIPAARVPAARITRCWIARHGRTPS